jgi:hypothetical protein
MIDPNDALAILRAVRPGEPPSPELAEALVALATQEVRATTSRPEDAKVGPGGHLGAAGRFRWMLERQTAPAFELVLDAAAKAVAAHLAAGDPDLVGIPISGCRVIDRPSELIGESDHPPILPGHPLGPILIRPHQVILDPRVLPDGHPLKALEPVDLQLNATRQPALFVGTPTVDKGRQYAGCIASISDTTRATKFFREAAEALRDRKAKERVKWEADRLKEQEQHEAAMLAAQKIAQGVSAADVALEVDSLKRQLAVLTEATKEILKGKIAEEKAAPEPAAADAPA